MLLFGDPQIAGSIVKTVTQIMLTPVSHTDFYIKYQLCTSEEMVHNIKMPT